jgi:hypothetical protein
MTPSSKTTNNISLVNGIRSANGNGVTKSGGVLRCDITSPSIST